MIGLSRKERPGYQRGAGVLCFGDDDCGCGGHECGDVVAEWRWPSWPKMAEGWSGWHLVVVVARWVWSGMAGGRPEQGSAADGGWCEF
ncbi:putative formin-like protein 6 isoform X2 [Iris pallida]|uniref:Formin-like protein 6 isoform X2 n=1 Tax=Iris pallida TaxID=29817 RepID=A0AAX6IHA6_IRIPA|nr:putative formin-like protein 6 isoform X2 [Iris pallida]